MVTPSSCTPQSLPSDLTNEGWLGLSNICWNAFVSSRISTWCVFLGGTVKSYFNSWEHSPANWDVCLLQVLGAMRHCSVKPYSLPVVSFIFSGDLSNTWHPLFSPSYRRWRPVTFSRGSWILLKMDGDAASEGCLSAATLQLGWQASWRKPSLWVSSRNLSCFTLAVEGINLFRREHCWWGNWRPKVEIRWMHMTTGLSAVLYWRKCALSKASAAQSASVTRQWQREDG